MYDMEVTLKEIAAVVGGAVDGDETLKVSRFAKIEEARSGDLSFLSNPKYEHFVYTTNATALLVSEDFAPTEPHNCAFIRVGNPYMALASLMEMVDKMRPQPQGIEPQSYIAEGVEKPEGLYVGAFAYIGRGVKLGQNVKIYPQAYIGDGCEIGDETIIRAGVKIYEGCHIGKRCIIHSGVVIGADGFGFAPGQDGYSKIPQIGNVVIEDDVEVGANTTIDRATFGSTVVGHGTKLDNLMQVAHNVVIGKHNVFASQTGIAGSTHIGDWNRVGGQCGFAGHIKVGNNNEFGAQSGIPNNVGDNNRLMGYPAVNASEFARSLVYVRRLPKLFKDVEQLGKSSSASAKECEKK